MDKQPILLKKKILVRGAWNPGICWQIILPYNGPPEYDKKVIIKLTINAQNEQEDWARWWITLDCFTSDQSKGSHKTLKGRGLQTWIYCTITPVEVSI